MYNLDLDEEEKIALRNLLKNMSWYRLMDLLCCCYKSDEETDKAAKAILRIDRKLEDD